MIAGKRLVVVDDTIVRGNTQQALVRMLREAGASEVHVRISAPPVKWPCFYGIDFATRAELIANGLDTEEICRSIGADSLGYVSLEGLVAATQVGKQALCRACFDGLSGRAAAQRAAGRPSSRRPPPTSSQWSPRSRRCGCPHPPLTPPTCQNLVDL